MSSSNSAQASRHALDYCRTRVAPPGSNLHYALLRLEGEPLQRALSLHAVMHELCSTVEGASDAAVAHRKLAWWLEEIERAQSGGATHPATRLLQSTSARPEALAPAVLGAENLLHAKGCASFDELERYGESTTGLALSLSICNAPNASSLARLGAALTLVRALSELRHRDGRSAALLPGTNLAEHEVEDEMLYASAASPQLVALVRAHAKRAGALCQRALCSVAAPHAGYARALSNMAAASLRKLEGNGFDPLSRDMNLTPLRKLWIAWLSG